MEEYEFKGHKILGFKEKAEDERYAFSFGKRKAKLFLEVFAEHKDAIQKFSEQ